MNPAVRELLFGGPPSWIPRADGLLPSNFADYRTEGAGNRYWNANAQQANAAAWWASRGTATFTRASSATDLLPISASGAAVTTFGSNAPVYIANRGRLYQGARTNVFLNSAAPVTQSITFATGTFTLWVNGTGSITTSAGTATGSGFGVATNGSSNTFVITGGGSVVFTAAGSLNQAQAETGAFGSSFITTGAGSVARAADSQSLTRVAPTSITKVIAGRTGPSNASGIDQTMWILSNGSKGIDIEYFNGHLHVFNTQTGTQDLDFGAYPPNTDFVIALRADSGAFAGSLNGGSILSSNAAVLQSGSTSEIEGAFISGSQWFSTIKGTAEFTNFTASNAALQALSGSSYWN